MDGTGRDTRKMRGTTAGVQHVARLMRREMTAAEMVLWKAIKDRQLCGLRFRAQHPVSQFVLDFFCPICKLVVELDGGVHDCQSEQDEARSAHLRSYGYHVIRFRNEEVMSSLPEVLEGILQAAAARRPDLRLLDL